MFALVLGLALLPWTHLPACGGYAAPPSASERAADAELISRLAHRATRASGIDAVVAAGDWRLVWATPSEAEPGVFFFHGPPGAMAFMDVWGGVATNRGEAARWAQVKVGAPAAVARCFASRLVQEGP